jgi:ribA/ribD-fused uncharacterized protein
MTDKYWFFYGGPFSQWYKSIFFDENGQKYVTAEQYMMAMKAKFFEDDEMYHAIMRTQNPMEQKALGRQVRNFDAAEWSAASQDIVFRGNLFKFTQSDELRKYLLNTGDKMLVEASPTDRIWGIGLGMDDPNRFDENMWRGTNWLGIAIMRVRDLIK